MVWEGLGFKPCRKTRQRIRASAPEEFRAAPERFDRADDRPNISGLNKVLRIIANPKKIANGAKSNLPNQFL
jgi:hypothetical protein